MKKMFLLLTGLITSVWAFASNTGVIKGKVSERNGKAVEYPSVTLKVDSIPVASTMGEEDGSYTFNQVNPGIYTVVFTSSGGSQTMIEKVKVNATTTTYVNIEIQSTLRLDGVVVGVEKKTWIEPVVKADFGGTQTFSKAQLDALPGNRADIIYTGASLNPTMKPSDDGKSFFARGSRAEATAIYIDGNLVYGSNPVPGIAIGGMTILAGGIPAMYGDVQGAIIVANTRSYLQGMAEKREMLNAIEEQEQQLAEMQNGIQKDIPTTKD